MRARFRNRGRIKLPKARFKDPIERKRKWYEPCKGCLKLRKAIMKTFRR